MAYSIDKVFVQTYEATVRHLAQQGVTRLRPFVMEKSVSSEAHNWERIGATAAVLKQAGSIGTTATPNNETPWSRRLSVPKTYHVGDLTEQEDIVQMLVDPNSNYARAHGMAMKRAHDAEIIAAASAAAAANGDGGTDTLSADQIIGDYTGELTYDIVTETTEKFMANDIDPDEPKVMVIGPKQARKLLQLTEATSGDYNAVRPLTSKGYIESWMGYSWIVHTDLEAPSADQLTCFAMTKRAIGFQMNKDIWARVEEDPTLSFAWRVYCASTFGAVRVEDEHIVQLKLADTV